ncbi:MAG: hypothetical protein FWC76_00685 [Defluviitaleaceae bacterium]|nr:hypothetical protein [Defluviitaleaceae bacterium]
MDKIKIIKTACVYTGLIFGAGFASGQEHLTFFLRYGRLGIAGIIVASVLIALCGWAVMDICVRQKIGNYREFMAMVFGPRLGAALDIITGVFIFVIFSAMLAATGAMGSEAAGLPFTWGVIFAAALCFIVLLFDLRGMVQINIIISPILVVGALLLGLYAIFGSAAPAFAARAVDNWPTSAVVYASYNLIPAVAVLAAMPKLVTSRKIARHGGILGGIFLGIIGIVLAVALLSNIGLIGQMELPMLALARNYGHLVANLYIILLFLAIFTTAATNAFSLTEWLAARVNFSKMRIKIAIIILGIAAAHVGFSNIVTHAYSFFGFLGIFIMVSIIIYFFRGIKHRES